MLQCYRKRIQPNRQLHDCSFVMHTRLWSYPADYILSMEKTFWLSARVETLSEYYYRPYTHRLCHYLYRIIIVYFPPPSKKGSVNRIL